VGQSQGAAGSTYQPIIFTNTGSSPCTLYGYPGVSLVAGSPVVQVGAAADRNTGETPELVTLQPQGTASATLRIVDAQNYPASSCGTASPTTGLQIYPPNQTVPIYVQDASTGCTNSATHLLMISVVVPGSNGDN
jgi:hypothetical protein